MDNAMVKRGIGAIVLAVIAALLLGYLLKDKSSQRQEVVDMKLPGAPEMNIPSLTGSSDTDTETTSTLLAASKDRLDSSVSSISDSAKGAGSAIIASAKGVTDKVTDAIKPTMDSTSAAIQGTKPGFAIRPSMPNEQKEIVDNTVNKTTTTTAPKIEETAKAVKDTVVASTADTTKKVTKAFKPEIVEKKKPAKPAAPKQAKAPSKPEKAESLAPIPSAAPAGKYSIQLLATSSQSRAGKLAKTMKSEGYNVFVTQTTRDNKVLYRVRVGGHSSRNSAIKAQESMKKRYQKNFFVQNSLVISN